MKKIFFLLLATVLFVSCGKEGVTVTVENTNDYDRSAEMVELSVKDIEAKVKLAEGQAYVVTNSKGEIVPSQVTFDGKLIFQSGVAANAKETYTVAAGEAQEFAAKTYGRFIQERKDDFAWENDRVAFRVYGPALVATDGPSNGIDIWYKRTSDLIVDKWYAKELAGEGSYHEDHGEGLDDYKVGRSLGAGAMAPYVDGKLWLNGNYATHEVLENGPLRSTFRFTYADLDVNGKIVKETRTFSIDAGSQFSKVVQEYAGADAMEVAAGFVKRPAGDSIISNEDFLIYAEPTTPKVSGMYVALVFPAGIKNSVVDTYTVDAKVNGGEYKHALAIADYKADAPIVYYTGYGWEKFGFATLADFETYAKNFSASLKQPLKVTIQ